MNNSTAVYIAGKITDYPQYKEKFGKAEEKLRKWGYVPLNPAILPAGLTQEEYLHICYAMIDVCEKVYFLNNWKDSNGAKLENEYAQKHQKVICYEKD